MVAKACLGIDVSKSRLDGVLEASGLSLSRRALHRVAPNSSIGVEGLCRWAAQLSGCDMRELRVVMEVTGGYHLVAARRAFEMGCFVCVVNPRRASQYGNAIGHMTKSDRVDASVLAQYGRAVSLRQWVPVPAEIEELSRLTARREAVEAALRCERCRMELFETEHYPSAVRSSVEEAIRFHLEASGHLTRAIEEHFERHSRLARDRELLISIPGIGLDAANHLICLLRGRVFENARQAAAFGGATPIHRQSGDQPQRAGKLPWECHRRFRVALHMPALAAHQHDRQLKAIYEQLLQRGKHPRRARAALVRRLMHIAFGVLKHQRPYDPDWKTKTPEERTVLRAPPGVNVRLRTMRSGRDSRLRRLAGQRIRRAGTPGPRRAWSSEELHLLRDGREGRSGAELARALGRTVAAVRTKLSALGVHLRSTDTDARAFKD